MLENKSASTRWIRKAWYTPDAIIKITGNPLADYVASLVRFDEALIVVHVGYVHQCLSLDCNARIVCCVFDKCNGVKTYSSICVDSSSNSSLDLV